MGCFRIELSLEQTEGNEKIVTKFSLLNFSWSSGNTKFRTEPFRLLYLHKVMPHEYFHLHFILDLHNKQNPHQKLCLVANIRLTYINNILMDVLNGCPFVAKYEYTHVNC